MVGRAALLAAVLAAVNAGGAPGAAAADVTAPDIPSQAPAEVARPALLPLPQADPERLEPQIAAQIEALSGLVHDLERDGAGRADQANAYAALGHLYVYYDDPEAAQVCYENSRRLAPGDSRWPYYLGFVASDLGETERAVELFTQALQLAPGDLPTLVRLGNLNLDLGRPEAAEGHYRRAVELSPDLAAGWHGLGRAAAARGDDRAAVEHFERTLELQPEASLVNYALGQAWRRLGEIDKARAALSNQGSGRVRFPDPLVDRLSSTTVLSSLDLVRSLAEDRERFPDLKFFSYTLAYLSNVEGAIEHLGKELATWPEERRQVDREQRARLHYALGGLLVHRGRGAEAAVHYRSALELAPDLDDARIKLANELARGEEFEEAADLLSAVLERDPENHAARLKRAASSMALGRWGPAAEDLLRLERTDPASYEVRFRLAVSLERLGRSAEALPRYLAAAELETSDERAARAWFQAGALLAGRGDETEAADAFRHSVERAPSLEARLNLAGLLIRSERYEEALGQFEAALGEHPQAFPPHLGRAMALLLLGRSAAAVEALKASIEALPGNPALTLILARVLAAAPESPVRDGERALELARRIESAQPSPRSAEAIALATAETGRFDEATRWQRTAVERARSAGQARLAEYFAARLPLYEAGRLWSVRSAAELIVLPGEG